MSTEFRDKIVIVTSGGRGMGKTIARAFIDAGAKVMVAARTVSHGERTVAEFRAVGGDATLCPCDMTRRDQVVRLVDKTVETYGTVDIVVHTAGELLRGSVLTLTDEVLEAGLACSVKAAYWLTQSAAPFLSKAAGGGRIIFISSICGPRTAVRGLVGYGITKIALKGFIEGAGLELIPQGITVNGVEPGVTWTDRMRALSDDTSRERILTSIPARRFAQPEEIARTVLFLASPKAGYITGQNIVVDGGLCLSTTDVADIGMH